MVNSVISHFDRVIPHLFEILFLISWENNRDCHTTMPLSLKTVEVQIKGDQWNKRFRMVQVYSFDLGYYVCILSGNLTAWFNLSLIIRIQMYLDLKVPGEWLLFFLRWRKELLINKRYLWEYLCVHWRYVHFNSKLFTRDFRGSSVAILRHFLFV